MRIFYALSGLLIGAAVNILINLLSAAIQQQAFANQFNRYSIWLLIIMSIIGLLIGYWLSAQVPIPTSPLSKPSNKLNVYTVTRLNALFSYAKLRGKGIGLGEILLIGSKLDIDTRDEDE